MKIFRNIVALTLSLTLAVVIIRHWTKSKESVDAKKVGSFEWFEKNCDFDKKEGCLLALIGDPKNNIAPPNSFELQSEGLISLVKNWPRDPDTKSALMRVLGGSGDHVYWRDKNYFALRKLTIQPLLDGWPEDEDVWEGFVSAALERDQYVDSHTNEFSESAWLAFQKAKIPDSYRKCALLRILRSGPNKRLLKMEASRSELASAQLLERWPDDIEVRDGLTAVLSSADGNRLVAAKALCKAWHDYPVTKQLLCDLIGGNAKRNLAKDGNWELRCELLDLLNAGWHDEDVKTVLIRAAAGVVAQNIAADENLSVRMRSVELLAAWKGDTSVTGALMRAVETAEDGDTFKRTEKLRRSGPGYEAHQAMKALAVQSNGNTSARDFVARRALCLTNGFMRYNPEAVEALAIGWKSDIVAKTHVIKVLELVTEDKIALQDIYETLEPIAKAWSMDASVRDVFLKILATQQSSADSRSPGNIMSDWSFEALCRSLAVGWSGDDLVRKALIHAIIGDAAMNQPRFRSDHFRETSVKTLGQGWAGDKDVMAALLLAAGGDSSREAMPDTSKSVRCGAIVALGQGWWDVPEVSAFLKHAALEGFSNASEAAELADMRESAIAATSKIWPHDPEIKNGLIALAVGGAAQPSMALRKSAIAALGKGWQGDSDVKQTLLRLAVQCSDDRDLRYEDKTIRDAVLASFGPNWNDDAEVKQLREKK